MATCHSVAHARLMGAISHKRYRQFVSHEPSRATALEGFLFSKARFVQRSENGRPGSRDSRERSRASTSAGPAGGNGASDRGPPMAGRTLRGSLGDAPYSRASRQYSFCNLVCRVCGSMNAGGEDFGYFVPGKRGFDSRLWFHVPWRRPHEGRRVAGSGSSATKSLRWHH
jgi:hypothetical protein